MSATADHLADPELLATEWELGALLGDRSVDDLLDEATTRAERFEAAHAGRVAELDGDGLGAAMHELEHINDLIGRRAARRPRQSAKRSSRACARWPSSTTRSPTTSRSRTACALTRTGWPAVTWPTRRRMSRSWRSSKPCATATTFPSAGTGSR